MFGGVPDRFAHARDETDKLLELPLLIRIRPAVDRRDKRSEAARVDGFWLAIDGSDECSELPRRNRFWLAIDRADKCFDVQRLIIDRLGVPQRLERGFTSSRRPRRAAAHS